MILGNDAFGTRTSDSTFYRFTIYNRTLDQNEINQSFNNERVSTGNITICHDFGTGLQGSWGQINYINDSYSFDDLYISPDNISFYLLANNATNATKISIPSSYKNQTQCLRAVKKGNLTSTPQTISLLIGSESSVPIITSWSNNYTNSVSLDLLIELFSNVNFNASADQSIETWNWFLNGTNQINNFDNLSYNFNKTGYKILEVNVTNTNGVSNTVQWNNTIKQAPEINISVVLT